MIVLKHLYHHDESFYMKYKHYQCRLVELDA